MAMKAAAVLDLTAPWRIALEGNRLTRLELGRLTVSYRVLHDVETGVDGGAIEHVVIGPTGVFIVHTRRSGRRSDKLIGHLRRQADWLTAITGRATAPIVCRHGGLRGEAPEDVTIGGVRFCNGGALRDVVTGAPHVLSNPMIAEIAAAVTGARGRGS